MIDDVFKDQLASGVIEEIEDLSGFFMSSNPGASFLSHMPVFKLNHESTKCRVVYLVNVGEAGRSETLAVNHNQALLAGPCLNMKLSTSFMNMQFDRKILIFDLKKAFLQIELYPQDTIKLCFLWVRNIHSDPSIVGYVTKRLTFGLRCSAFILMLLYIIY